MQPKGSFTSLSPTTYLWQATRQSKKNWNSSQRNNYPWRIWVGKKTNPQIHGQWPKNSGHHTPAGSPIFCCCNRRRFCCVGQETCSSFIPTPTEVENSCLPLNCFLTLFLLLLLLLFWFSSSSFTVVDPKTGTYGFHTSRNTRAIVSPLWSLCQRIHQRHKELGEGIRKQKNQVEPNHKRKKPKRNDGKQNSQKRGDTRRVHQNRDGGFCIPKSWDWGGSKAREEKQHAGWRKQTDRSLSAKEIHCIPKFSSSYKTKTGKSKYKRERKQWKTQERYSETQLSPPGQEQTTTTTSTTKISDRGQKQQTLKRPQKVQKLSILSVSVSVSLSKQTARYSPYTTAKETKRNREMGRRGKKEEEEEEEEEEEGGGKKNTGFQWRMLLHKNRLLLL